jgi:hypothetical protein
MTLPAPDDSTSPQEVDPKRILDEARACTAMGRYVEALDKHLWFHHRALEHRRSLYGVRLSYALHDWVYLGSVYPPALEELKRVRDECAARMRGGEGDRWVFNDFRAINQHLGEEHQTRELFVWLDANLPDRAREVYHFAQPALLEAREYRLCGRYLDPDASLQRLRQLFQSRHELRQDPRFDQVLAKNPGFDQRFEERSQRNFTTDAATLVALLVINDRKADAERIAAQALGDHDTSEFRELLEQAMRGEVPKQRRTG